MSSRVGFTVSPTGDWWLFTAHAPLIMGFRDGSEDFALAGGLSEVKRIQGDTAN